MPAGSGPVLTPLSAVAVGTSEAVAAVVGGSWSSTLGNLLELSALFTPPATTGTLTLRLRQGSTVTGTQIGQTWTLPFTSGVAGAAAIAAPDATAYGQAQQAGSYCVTASYTATGGTLSGVLTLETVAPLL
jgi:hypothetical protein